VFLRPSEEKDDHAMITRHRRSYAQLAIILTIGLNASACDKIWDWSLGPGQDLSKVLDSFRNADRMIIKDRPGDQVRTETRE
jgi:hypothetical protein